MKSLVVLLMLFGSTAMANEKKINVRNGWNVVKVTVSQELGGCEVQDVRVSVAHIPSKEMNRFYVVDDRNLDDKQLLSKIARLNSDKTCPGFSKVTRTVQFITYGGELSIVAPFPWQIEGEPQVSIIE